MFEHLDDISEPKTRPLDDVVKRGTRIRAQRQLALGAGVLSLVVVVMIATVSLAATGSDRHKVIVAAGTSTSGAPSASTTEPDGTTSTSAPGDMTTSSTLAPPVVVAPPTAGVTTTAEYHDPHDYSLLSYVYGTSAPLSLETGESQAMSYTVTNNGPWTVTWTEPNCEFSVWGNQNYVWPDWEPRSGWGCSATEAVTLAPGAVHNKTVLVTAGYHNAAGVLIPARPGGGDVFYPPPLTEQPGVCVSPCRNVYLQFASPPQYQANYPARTTVASGSHKLVSFTIVNRVNATATVEFDGPCTWVQGSAAKCRASTTKGGNPDPGKTSTLVLPPNSTVTAHADLYATSDLAAPSAGNTALAPGSYQFTWGNSVYGLTVT